MIRVLALSAAVDITYEVDRLELGGINRPEATTVVAGGKALNMARVAHALGAEVEVVAALGGSNGQRVRRMLEADGIRPVVVDLDRETRTCLAIVESDGGATSTDVYEQATPFSAEEWTRFTEMVRSAPAADRVTLSGAVPDGVRIDELAHVLAEARANGSRVALDLAGAALAALVAPGDLVKVNRDEAAGLLGESQSDALAACRALRHSLAVDAVVTDGVRGAAAVVGGVEHLLPAPRVQGRFPAGSGDAFFGGLIGGLDRGLVLADALDLARDAAERNAQRPGQGLLA